MQIFNVVTLYKDLIVIFILLLVIVLSMRVRKEYLKYLMIKKKELTLS